MRSGFAVRRLLTLRPHRSHAMKLGAAALVLGMLATAWYLGIFARVSEPRELAHALVLMGGWGYLAFVVAYATLQPFGVPGTIFIVAAPLIWPWKAAFALSMCGTVGASIVGFSFARFVARDWVSTRIPQRLQRHKHALERRPFSTVLVLRLVFWMHFALSSFFGVSKVRFWTHFWASLIAYIPTLLLVSYLGGSMFDASGRLQPGAWPILPGLLTASLVIAVLARAWERRRPSEDTSPS